MERSDEMNPLIGVDLPLRPKVPQEIEIRPIKMRQRVKESIDSFFGFFSGNQGTLNQLQGLTSLKHAYIKHNS